MTRLANGSVSQADEASALQELGRRAMSRIVVLRRRIERMKVVGAAKTPRIYGECQSGGGSG